MKACEYFCLMMKDGFVCDFQKHCTRVTSNTSGCISFLNSSGAALAVIPTDNIWTIYRGDMKKLLESKQSDFLAHKEVSK